MTCAGLTYRVLLAVIGDIDRLDCVIEHVHRSLVASVRFFPRLSSVAYLARATSTLISINMSGAASRVIWTMVLAGSGPLPNVSFRQVVHS